MSHFYVLVAGDDFEEQLAPFNEVDENYYDEEETDEDTGETYKYNPNTKWDWYEVGGRWSGALRHRNGTSVDELPKKDFDLDALVQEARQNAYSLFDAYAPAFAGKEIPSWESTVAAHNRKHDDARAAYDSHPVIRAIRDLEKAYGGFDAPHRLPWEQCLHSVFCGGDREAMAAQYMEQAGVPYAMLVNGEWFEKGTMGWFGISEGDKDDWPAQFRALLADLSDDTTLTVVDCHI